MLKIKILRKCQKILLKMTGKFFKIELHIFLWLLQEEIVYS